MNSSSPSAPLLEVRDLAVQFPAVRALDGITMSFRSGEVHGVIGENGAGKSTLMRVLGGLQAPTEGSVYLDGAEVKLRTAGDAFDRGIVMIHQELNLVDELTAAENIFLGREPKKGLVIDKATMNARAQGLLDEVRAPFPPTIKVSELSVAQKQLVEIAKALSYDARLVIMDEPTAVLSHQEIESLFALIDRLRKNGVAVVYISHILSELLRICDRITVLRDGRYVDSMPGVETSAEGLAKLMVGRDIGDFFPPKNPQPDGDPALEVEGLTVAGVVYGVDLRVRPGEIVGLAGLIGSGRTETAEAIIGVRKRTAGTIKRNGTAVSIQKPQDSLKHGIAYVSEDRKGSGLHLTMPTKENITLANLSVYAKPVVNTAKQNEAVQKWVKDLDIRVGDVGAPVGFLSGGNQQKVSVAKWLDTKPAVLILDEPTRGVDVGAKREIYELIQELAKEGLACLVISSEMTELIGLCHRILVLRGGKVEGELQGNEMTEENIMMLAAGVGA